MKVLPKALRDAVWNRSRGYCEKCGLPLHQDSWNWHHRKIKSQGGQDLVENGLALHFSCHRWIHDNPAESYKYGYMVPNGDTPLGLPVLLPNGLYATLTNDGHYDYHYDDEKEGV